jgi:hypothetical protein
LKILGSWVVEKRLALDVTILVLKDVIFGGYLLLNVLDPPLQKNRSNPTRRIYGDNVRSWNNLLNSNASNN